MLGESLLLLPAILFEIYLGISARVVCLFCGAAGCSGAHVTGRFSLVVSFKCLGARTVTAFSALQFIITIIYSILFIYFFFVFHATGLVILVSK